MTTLVQPAKRERSDALVFFGATGDLAYKKIFPALHAMAKRGKLDFPVVGVARSGHGLNELVERARASCTEYGGLDPSAFAQLVRQMRYVDGDYNDPVTFQHLKKELGDCERPTHYLAIPPSMFGPVIEQLGASGAAENARVVVEKPFGRDLQSARELDRIIHTVFPEHSGTEKESPLAPRPGAVRGMSGQGGSHDDLQRLDIVALDRARESLLETSRSRWPPLAAPFGASSRAHALSAWALKTLCSSAPMRACASTFVRPTIHARDIARQCRWSALIVSATEPRSL